MEAKETIRFIDAKIHGFCGENKRWVILEEKPESLQNHGEDPFQRPLNKLLELGVINIDKPPGPTSHEVVAWIKKMLGLKRAGHGGTLES